MDRQAVVGLFPWGVVMSQVDVQVIGEIVRRIVDAVDPEAVVLFGSHARDNAGRQSDLDLLVVAESSEPRHRRAACLYGTLSDILLPMDILVYTPEEVHEWSGVPQAFVTTALREGRALYEKQGRSR